MRRVLIFNWYLAGLWLMFGFWPGQPAYAEHGFELSPSKIEVNLAPGEQSLRDLQLTNHTSLPVAVDVHIEDLAPGQTSGEVVQLLGEGSNQFSLKPFLTPLNPSFSLAPGESTRVPLLLDLPLATPAGGKHGAVIFSFTPVGPPADAVSRLGAMFFLRVAGAANEAGELVAFGRLGGRWFHQVGAGPLRFHLDYENRGNVYLNPYGRLTIINRLTGLALVKEIDPWFVLPGSIRLREIELPSPAVGWYRVTLTLNRGYGDLIDEGTLDLFVWSWPLGLVVALTAAVLIAFLIIFSIRRRRGLTLLLIGSLLFSFLVGQSPLRAEVASSTNYRLQIDSLNFGGQLSTSNNYRLEDTLGEIGTGDSSSAGYQIKAGYQSMLSSSITISAPSNLSLTAIDTAPGGQSEGSVAWTVTTDSAAGYTLALKAAANPALQSTNSSFVDYAPSGGNPDYDWSVAATTAEFGFSPEGADLAARYLDNGSSCAIGSGDTVDRCWDGFSTTNRTIASRPSNNTPTGSVTTVKIKAEIGAEKIQPAGAYSATITATALAS